MPDKELEAILPVLAERFARVRSALVVGFANPAVIQTLNEFRPGIWMDETSELPLPFENDQFEVVVVAAGALSREMVREVNRVLRPQGCMFFSVQEKRSNGDGGYSSPEIYKLIREGFDIISVKRPKWWYFGLKGHTLTVCAAKKAWRERRGIFENGVYLFTPFRGKTG